MKNVFLTMLFISSGLVCFGQNPDIDIKLLSSTEGKQWRIMVRPDGYQVATSMHDDLFIFFTGGQFKYDQSGTVTEGLANTRTKTWSYNKNNNVLSWEYFLPGGTSHKIDAEVTYIDADRTVLNMSENGKEPNIVVLISN